MHDLYLRVEWAVGVMKERLVARVAADFFLRYADDKARRFGGSFQRAIIYYAIVQGNLAHIGHLSPESLRYAEIDSPPPDRLRRPIPINAVANSLNLPYETVRRHVNGLIEGGYCVKVRGKGVVIPTAALETSENLAALRETFERVRRMVILLRKAGIEFNED